MVTGVKPNSWVKPPVRLFVGMVRPQDVREELVEAIPVPLLIEWGDEEVAALKELEHRLAVVLPGDGITQGAAQLVENGGMQQEAA